MTLVRQADANGTLRPVVEDSVLHFIGALNSLKGFSQKGKT